jgi:hypothetical protein
MANKVLLKKSSFSAKVPELSDLDYGEVAINYADGKLYYKTSSNAIDSFPSKDATATLSNKTLSSPVLTGSLTAGGSAGASGQFLKSTASGVAWDDIPFPTTTTYTAASISVTDGVYISGSLSDIQTFNDGNYYYISDGTGAGPAWIITIGFTGVTAFNRVVMNIDYTANSGHTIYVQVYNYITSTWDAVGTYNGLTGYYQFALQVLDYSNYINSSSTVSVRLYHSNTGNANHYTKLDYAALENSAQGPQGPRGLTGATGATGAAGTGVPAGGTSGQVLTKNSSTNYDTYWADSTGGSGASGTTSFARTFALMGV